jgi:phosphatidylserine/phosphatidylglycerophosphate/cardiolipin synthase-like enzyme
MALSEAAKEGVFLRRFLDELGLGADSPTSLAPPTALATDNKAARDLAYNPEHHEKTKHIERRHFYVRELVESEELIVPFVSTTANMADFFTKP